MTTERIDVLAVMEHCASRTATLEQGRQLSEARAAVAELIEAAQGQHKAIDALMARVIELDPDFLPTRSAVWPLLIAGRAAIARAGGAGG